MSDDEADPELLELLRQSLGLTNRRKDEISKDTGVLKDAEYIYDNAIDVSIDMYGTKAAAASIYSAMKERGYSTQAWSQQELHPTRDEGFSDIDIVNFIFTLDLLNFSFWSKLSESERFQVEYKGKRWTGYRSLLACLRRALDEDIPVTTPTYWNDPACSDEILMHVFRSATSEEMSLLPQRIAILREAGQVLTESLGDPETEPEDSNVAGTIDETMPELGAESEPTSGAPTLGAAVEEEHDPNDRTVDAAAAAESVQRSNSNVDTVNHVSDMQVVDTPERPLESEPAVHRDPGTQQATNEAQLLNDKLYSRTDPSVTRLIEKAEYSAGKLVNLLVKYFPSFRDETRYNSRKVRFFKRAQIFVADLWAAFNGTGYGKFDDIDHLTMFADYRVPQMLHSIGVLVFSPPLDYAIRDKKELKSGDRWEVQLRGCSIWAVELIRREILKMNPEALNINAVLIDFFLYDLAKEREASGMCCSQYGYCGAGPQYCSGSSANSFGPPSGGGGAPGSYPHQGPPGGFGPPSGSPQGPPQGPPSGIPSGGAPPSQPPSPSGAAPVPSGGAPSQPSGFPQPSGAPSEPSGAPSVPSQPPSPSGAPPAPSGGAPSQPSGFPSQPSGAPSQPSVPPTAPSGAPAPSAPAQPSGSAAPAPSSAPGGSGGGLGNVYKFYTGDGSPTAGWPAQDQWADFESLWSANLPTISISCTQFGEKNNSPQESDEMKAAIQSVGASEGIDPRVILAVVMQESKGCVRVITTDNGVVNPGLMQSHDGQGSCNSGGDGAPGLDPCPSTQITQMIHDGSVGTASGAGLKEVLPQCTATDIAQKYYQAATIYNSGNLPQNLDDNTATACYASDIANRLTGWTTAQTQCNL